jgi:trimethylamine---corrinoid protein Co-methyltransferase
MTEPEPIMAPPARLALKILSDDDVARVHAAALALLGAEGAAADEAPRQAPDEVALGGRVVAHDAVLGTGHNRLGTGGPAARVRPREGGDPRPATVVDLDEACRLADALPEIAVVFGPPLHAAGETPLGELARCLAATSKHVQVTTLRSAAEAEAAVRMALAVAGSEAELRARPPISLCGGPEALDAASVFARAGLPVGVVAPPDGRGAEEPAAEGSPAAVAGALVRHHAGVLAACAATQAAAPGAPFMYFADPVLAGLSPAGPEAAMFQIAAAQLAAHLGLPVVAGGMATASHEPDWQACTQNAFAALSTTAARAGLTLGAGVLGGYAFSAQQLVMDGEIFSWNAFIAAGIVVDDETLALDAIKQVDICGNFLSQRHTRRHMKDVWRPRLLDRSMWDAWVASGREGAYEKATALVDKLLTEHQVWPLGDEVSGTLARIVAEAGL